MTTTANLEQVQLHLDAGHEAVVPLMIRNSGDIVEGYNVEVVGVPADWTVVEPAQISLYPGDTATARVAFRPPRTPMVPAGELPFGVRVVPVEHPNEAVVTEGVIEVLPFLETTAELVPRTSHGRRRGVHQVAIDNRGNIPVSVALAAGDPAGLLDIAVKPTALVINPGTAAFVNVKVAPDKLIWRGAPTTHPFAVAVTPHAGTPVNLDGAYLQEAVIPKWLPKALLALLAVLALLAALWFAVLRPTIRSAAKDAVAQPLNKAQSQAVAAQSQAAAAQSQAAAADNAAAQAQQRAQASGGAPAIATPSSARGAPAPVVKPLSQRLETLTASGATSSTPFTVPSRTTVDLTDLVLENPQGDFGDITLEKVTGSGTSTLLSLALENFRDIDYHFVSPIVAQAGEQIVMRVQCNAPGAVPHAPTQPTSCDTAVFLGGTSTGPAT